MNQAPKLGRPNRGDRKMPRRSCTASVEHWIFLQQYGGEQTYSAGLRRVIEVAVSLDAECKELMDSIMAAKQQG